MQIQSNRINGTLVLLQEGQKKKKKEMDFSGKLISVVKMSNNETALGCCFCLCFNSNCPSKLVLIFLVNGKTSECRETP